MVSGNSSNNSISNSNWNIICSSKMRLISILFCVYFYFFFLNFFLLNFLLNLIGGKNRNENKFYSGGRFIFNSKINLNQILRLNKF